MTGNLINQKVGPYKIVEQIGSGGMATVFKAYHSAMERFVAIKVLPPNMAQDPNFAARFAQEARTISRLEHPFILPVYDSGNKKGMAYIVMRYLEAGTLADLLAKGRPHLRYSIRLIQRIAEALDYAHSQGVIHRDLKPSNILIDKNGQPYLTDFGIAKILEGSLNLTGAAIIGTPAYMSPEQGQGAQIDHRSDIYSLGVVLYEAATGRKPYEGSTPMATLQKHIHAPLPSPSTFASDIPPLLESIIVKAMSKSPDDRFATAGEFANALEETLIGMTATGQLGTGPLTPVTPTPRTPTPPPFTPAPIPIKQEKVEAPPPRMPEPQPSPAPIVPEPPPAPAREPAPVRADEPALDIKPETIYRPISEIRREPPQPPPVKEAVTRLEKPPVSDHAKPPVVVARPPSSKPAPARLKPKRAIPILAVVGIAALCIVSLAIGAGGYYFVTSSNATSQAALTASVEAAAAAHTGTARAIALLNATKPPTATYTPSPTATDTPTATATDTETPTATETRVFLTSTFTPMPFLTVVVKNSWDTDIRARVYCPNRGYDQRGTARDFSNPAIFFNVPAGSCNLEAEWGGGGRPTGKNTFTLNMVCKTGNTIEFEITRDGALVNGTGACYNR